MADVNADFAARAAVHAGSLDWVPSPTADVDRRMLDRVGDEVARATSIVRYAPGSQFPRHVHGGGEEFLVLSGVFEDEHGAYPAGSYLRNPPTSSHTPGSTPGCEIFVKLWQFDPDDRNGVRLHEGDHEYKPANGRAGVSALVLHEDPRETVRLERWAPGRKVDYAPAGGLELLVLTGAFSDSGERFVEHSWLRLPVGAELNAVAGDEGTKLWVKEGHLAAPPPLPREAG